MKNILLNTASALWADTSCEQALKLAQKEWDSNKKRNVYQN
jgi:anthranilate phosphoribosyltransferase